MLDLWGLEIVLLLLSPTDPFSQLMLGGPMESGNWNLSVRARACGALLETGKWKSAIQSLLAPKATCVEIGGLEIDHLEIGPHGQPTNLRTGKWKMVKTISIEMLKSKLRRILSSGRGV